MLRLILTSDIADLCIALRDTPMFTGYLLARGYDATYRSVFTGLLKYQPWRDKDGGRRAPWRIAADDLVV